MCCELRIKMLALAVVAQDEDLADVSRCLVRSGRREVERLRGGRSGAGRDRRVPCTNLVLLLLFFLTRIRVLQLQQGIPSFSNCLLCF